MCQDDELSWTKGRREQESSRERTKVPRSSLSTFQELSLNMWWETEPWTNFKNFSREENYIRSLSRETRMHKSQKNMSIKSWPLPFLYQNEVRLKIFFRPKPRLYLGILVNSKSKCFEILMNSNDSLEILILKYFKSFKNWNYFASQPMKYI